MAAREPRRARAVVIGSGFGGLAAAIRLGARGYRVTVLEKLDAPGGRAYVYRQDGFTFDAGPTIVTAPFLFEELWQLCGREMADDVELRPMSPFYRIRFDDGASFDYSGDAAAMRAEVARFSPQDVDGYDAFHGDEPRHLPRRLRRARRRAVLPRRSTWCASRRTSSGWQGYRTVYALVSQHFSDPRLRTVFSFHPLLIGGNPFAATSIYCLIA